MYLSNLKSVALPVPELTTGSQKFEAVPGYAHALCPLFPPPKSYMPTTHTMYVDSVDCMCTRFPEQISGQANFRLEFRVGGYEPPILGKGRT